jgi:hypothetical protein
LPRFGIQTGTLWRTFNAEQEEFLTTIVIKVCEVA